MAARSSRVFVLFLSVALTCADRSGAAPFVPERDAQCVAYSPDGKLAATAKSGLSNSEFPPRPHPSPRKCGVVHLWNVQTGKPVRRIETFGDITQVAFSPDGRQLAYARLFATTDGLRMNEVKIWDVQSGKLLHLFDRCRYFEFAPDGRSIVVLSRTRCTRFATASGNRQQDYPALQEAVAVRFSPDGKRLAGIVPHDQQYRLLSCRAVDGEQLAESVNLHDPFYSLTFAPGGRLLATGHPEGVVLLWDAESLDLATRLRTGGKGIQHPFFSPDGSLLASGDQTNGDVVFWQLSSGKEVRRYTFQQGELRTYLRRDDSDPLRPETDPTRFAFSPSGEAFLAGCFGGIIRAVSDGRQLQRFAE